MHTPMNILRAPQSRSYLSAEERRKAIQSILESKQHWIQHTHVLREFAPDAELQNQILSIYSNSPWQIQIHSNSIAELFPTEFFKKAIEKECDFSSGNLFSFFLLLNAHHDICAFDGKLRQILKEKVKDAPTIQANLFGKKEPGFACGGMEKNYYESVRNNHNQGICLVNNSLLAKYFHRKGESKKVSYLPITTFITNNGYPIWKDYFYAPSNNQHTNVIRAIENNQQELTIENLSIKSVRPANGITSEGIYKLFQNKNHQQ